MIFDFSIKDTYRYSILNFYHTLQVMSPLLDIYLKSMKDMSHNSPTYLEVDLMHEKKFYKMNSDTLYIIFKS